MTKRILPFVCALFVLSFLDRVNLSYAALDMTRELGFGPSVYGLGAGLFLSATCFLRCRSQDLLQAQCSLLVVRHANSLGHCRHRYGDHTYRSRFLCLPHSSRSSGSGLLPGHHRLSERLVSERDRARAIGALAVGLPAANLIGGPISGFLLSQHWLQITGWRWLFIMEGLPSVIAGILTYRFLFDSPAQSGGWRTKNAIGS